MFNRKTLRVVAGCLMAVFVLIPLAVQALDGTYRGVYDNQPVTASFNTLESSLTGVLNIGGERYTLLADKTPEGYSGQLNNVANGEKLAAELRMVDGRLAIQIRNGKGPMRFELKKKPCGD